MPEHNLPQFNQALLSLRDVMSEAVTEIRDFRASLQYARSPRAVIAAYDLLRKQNRTTRIVIESRRKGKG